MSEYRGLVCSPHEVLVTSGIRHALALVCRTLVPNGAAACFEDPCYAFAPDILTWCGARAVPVPVDAGGVDVGALRRVNDARLVYVTPAHQSPLGIRMSVARRLELLDLVAERQIVLVEDDYDSEFSYTGAPLPALAALDGSGLAVYCGSFNKTLRSDLRIGFVVARGDQLRRLTRVWDVLGRAVPGAEQVALAQFMECGAYARHLRIARRTYARRRDLLLRVLEQEASGSFAVEGAEAGLHMLLWLPHHVDAEDLCSRAAAVGLDIQPLSAFCIETERDQAIVLGYASLNEAEIRAAGATLGRLLRINRLSDGDA